MIEQAFLHIDVEWIVNDKKEKVKKFIVRGISLDADKNNRKWYLFAQEDQVPSAYSVFESDILKLRVISFRNMCVQKDKLAA